MPNVRKEPVVALFIADTHWSELAPSARCIEDDWAKVQKGYARQLRALWKVARMPPIFIAGDLFARWNSTPRTISLVIEMIAEMEVIAIPGNHDTPDHNYKELHRSAYWTLVQAGIIKHLEPGQVHECKEGMASVTGWPSGHEVQPPQTSSLGLKVALIHDFIWTAATGYTDAPESKFASKWLPRLKGYDVAVFGDNHKGFLSQSDTRCSIYNCGSFMRRYQDEVCLQPCIGVLYASGRVGRFFLDVKADRFLDLDKESTMLSEALLEEFEGLADELKSITNQRLSYAQTVIDWLEKNKDSIPPGIQNFMLLGVQNNANGERS